MIKDKIACCVNWLHRIPNFRHVYLMKKGLRGFVVLTEYNLLLTVYRCIKYLEDNFKLYRIVILSTL